MKLRTELTDEKKDELKTGSQTTERPHVANRQTTDSQRVLEPIGKVAHKLTSR